MKKMISVLVSSVRFLPPVCRYSRLSVFLRCYSEKLENFYNDEQKHTLIQVINENSDILSKYDISKSRLKKFMQWKENKGTVNKLSDVEMIEGFTERIAKKFFDSILNGSVKDVGKLTNKIKGQILHPHLSDSVIKKCRAVLTMHITVNSVCWILIDKHSYEVLEWKYYGIDYPDGKRFQITDIMDIAWRIIHQLPTADIYVMKAEATTLRAAGSDPNNPKQLAVNLQKAQMVAMIVALINASGNVSGLGPKKALMNVKILPPVRKTSQHREEPARNSTGFINIVFSLITGDNDNVDDFKLEHKVYFLRPSLPYRLYGTLVGSERVSTDQTVEMLLRDTGEDQSRISVKVPETLKNMFRGKDDLEKDMLGHCFLLGLTFMDLCIYKDQERVARLLKYGP